MLQFHADEYANDALNLINRASRSVTRGIEREVLGFKWSFHQLPATALEPAIERLIADGWLTAVQRTLRLTALGYARMTAPAIVDDGRELATPAARSGRSTEYGVRNRVLSVFRGRRSTTGSKLGAEDLGRFWQAAEYRASDLRDGLDVLLRDGELKMGRFGKTVFRLEEDGYRYTQGPEAPPSFLPHAPAVEARNLRAKSSSDLTLCVLAAYQFRAQRAARPLSLSELDYLLERYRLPAFARFHAVELLHRLGYARIADEGGGLVLTGEGRELQRLAESGVMQSLVGFDLRQASNDGEGHE
jgi:hypothetical protein